MSLIELFIIAVGLSMDAFAVSICKGLSMQKMSWKNAVIVGPVSYTHLHYLPLLLFMVVVLQELDNYIRCV